MTGIFDSNATPRLSLIYIFMKKNYFIHLVVKNTCFTKSEFVIRHEFRCAESLLRKFASLCLKFLYKQTSSSLRSIERAILRSFRAFTDRLNDACNPRLNPICREGASRRYARRTRNACNAGVCRFNLRVRRGKQGGGR